MQQEILIQQFAQRGTPQIGKLAKVDSPNLTEAAGIRPSRRRMRHCVTWQPSLRRLSRPGARGAALESFQEDLAVDQFDCPDVALRRTSPAGVLWAGKAPLVKAAAIRHTWGESEVYDQTGGRRAMGLCGAAVKTQWAQFRVEGCDEVGGRRQTAGVAGTLDAAAHGEWIPRRTERFALPVDDVPPECDFRPCRIRLSRPRMGGIPCRDILDFSFPEPRTTSTAAFPVVSSSSTTISRRSSSSKHCERFAISTAGRFSPGAFWATTTTSL